MDKSKDVDIVSKSIAGSFPILQLEDGETCLSESLSIARYLSNGKYGFYGPEILQKAKVDQWIDIISQRVAAPAQLLTL